MNNQTPDDRKKYHALRLNEWMAIMSHGISVARCEEDPHRYVVAWTTRTNNDIFEGNFFDEFKKLLTDVGNPAKKPSIKKRTTPRTLDAAGLAAVELRRLTRRYSNPAVKDLSLDVNKYSNHLESSSSEPSEINLRWSNVATSRTGALFLAECCYLNQLGVRFVMNPDTGIFSIEDHLFRGSGSVVITFRATFYFAERLALVK